MTTWVSWVSCELSKALDCGYRLDKVYEVWHFPRQNTDLFRRNIDTFLKIKQEASGFPPQCETEEKQNYIQEIFQREKIVLDSTSIEKNPVRRTIAKLFLNCLWGKSAAALDSIPDRSRRIEQDAGRQHHCVERHGLID